MLIIDSQVHIWGANTPERPWPAPGEGGRTAVPQRDIPLNRVQLLDEMDRAGVTGVVIVPPSWEGEYNDLAIEAASRHPTRFAIMGRLEPSRKDAAEQLPGWKNQPGMLGLRYLFTPSSPWLAEGANYWLWAQAEKNGLPVTMAPRGHFKMMGEIAERHPGLKMSIDHMGSDSSKKDAGAFEGLDEMLKLAKLPNMAVKVSALPCVSSEAYPYPLMQTYLKKVYDAFGPERMFWGTDLSRLPCTYRQAVLMFTEDTPWLKGQDLELVMGKAVARWFGWKQYA